jgi:hypothetical protein
MTFTYGCGEERMLIRQIAPATFCPGYGVILRKLAIADPLPFLGDEWAKHIVG